MWRRSNTSIWHSVVHADRPLKFMAPPSTLGLLAQRWSQMQLLSIKCLGPWCHSPFWVHQYFWGCKIMQAQPKMQSARRGWGGGGGTGRRVGGAEVWLIIYCQEIASKSLNFWCWRPKNLQHTVLQLHLGLAESGERKRNYIQSPNLDQTCMICLTDKTKQWTNYKI